MQPFHSISIHIEVRQRLEIENRKPKPKKATQYPGVTRKRTHV
jgi:hypothetical protein